MLLNVADCMKIKANGHGLADWLITRTHLTPYQIANWVGLSVADVRKPLGARAASYAMSPIGEGLLHWAEIRRCERSPDAVLEKRVGPFPAPKLKTPKFDAASASTTFHCARLGAVYYLGYGRNAWHATPVRYRYADRFFNDIATAEDRAEQLRRQGSYFFIRPTPVVVLQADSLTLVGVNFTGPSTSRGISAAYEGKLTAKSIINAGSAMVNRLRWLSCPGNYRFDSFDRIVGTMYVSRSAGTKFLLCWDEEEYVAPDIRTKRSVVSAYTRSIRDG